MNKHSINNVPVYLKVAQNLRLNIALCAAHGRGKTKIFQKYAEDEGYELITIILSRLLPEDLCGLPTIKTDKKGNKVTAYSEPDWLVKAGDPDRKVLLFFDEFNNGEMDVQAAILNLIEDRKMGEVELADTTQIVMAFNPTSIAPNAKQLSKATRDRICVIPLVDDTVAYKKYYNENEMESLSNILSTMPELVPNYDDESVDAAYENAEFTFRSLEKAYKICKYGYENKIDKTIIADMVCGYCGPHGNSFVQAVTEELSGNEIKEKIMKELEKSKNVDEFISKVIKQQLLSPYKNYADMRVVVNKIKDKYPKEAFEKFLNACLTKEFIGMYKIDEIED